MKIIESVKSWWKSQFSSEIASSREAVGEMARLTDIYLRTINEQYGLLARLPCGACHETCLYVDFDKLRCAACGYYVVRVQMVEDASKATTICKDCGGDGCQPSEPGGRCKPCKALGHIYRVES